MSPGLEDVQTKDNRNNKLYTAQGCASFATRTTQFAAGPWIGVELDVEHISEGFLVHADYCLPAISMTWHACRTHRMARMMARFRVKGSWAVTGEHECFFLTLC